MDKAFKNAVSMLKVSVVEAVKMVSSNPAAVLGLADKKGYLKIGYDADIVMLDEGLNVRRLLDRRNKKILIGGE